MYAPNQSWLKLKDPLLSVSTDTQLCFGWPVVDDIVFPDWSIHCYPHYLELLLLWHSPNCTARKSVWKISLRIWCWRTLQVYREAVMIKFLSAVFVNRKRSGRQILVMSVLSSFGGSRRGGRYCYFLTSLTTVSHLLTNCAVLSLRWGHRQLLSQCFNSSNLEVLLQGMQDPFSKNCFFPLKAMPWCIMWSK